MENKKTPRFSIDTKKCTKDFLKKKNEELEKSNLDKDFVKWLTSYNLENNCTLQIIKDFSKVAGTYNILRQLEIAFLAGKENL